MLYETILFDLDGTITNSAAGIIHSLTYALNKMNISVPEKTVLYSMIGPPLKESFKDKLGLDDDQTETAILYYREYFQQKGMYENQVYQGIPELLQKLKQAGCQLFVATSKPEIFAQKILDYFELSIYFEKVYGASLDEKRSKKAEIIQYILSQEKIHAADKVIMIGDRMYDILGAKENNLATIGVLYGFGEKLELKMAGADYIVKEPKEILKIIVD